MFRDLWRYPLTLMKRNKTLRLFQYVDIKNELADISQLVFQIILILGIYSFMTSSLFKFRNISESFYVLSSFEKLHYLFLLTLNDPFLFLLVITFFILFRITWINFSHEKHIKTFVLLVALIYAWKFAFYDYNFYYNASHLDLRLGLITLFLLSFWRPAFLLPFATVSLLIIHQLDFPLGNVSITDKRIVLDILILFLSFTMFNINKRIIRLDLFIVLLLVLHASNYVIPAITKLNLGPHYYEYIKYNKISNLFIGSYMFGWLNFLDKEIIVNFHNIISKLNPVLAFCAILVQGSAIFLLRKKKITLMLLLSFEGLHLGIFLFSGIFFWKWIWVNILIFCLLRKLSQIEHIFSIRTTCLSIILISISPFIFKPFALGWWDLGLGWNFEFEVITEGGDELTLNRTFFSPYDIIFAQKRFNYLHDNKTLSGTYATLPWRLNIPKEQKISIYKEINSSSNLDKIGNIIETYGIVKYDSMRSKKFYSFLHKYIQNYNERLDKRNPIIGIISTPNHIFTSYNKSYSPSDGKIKTLKIYFNRFHIWKNTIQEFDRELIRTICFS